MTTKPLSSRRKFLATLGVGGAAAAAVVLKQAGGNAAPAALGAGAAGGKGYQLTEHVRNYYRTAKI